MKLIFAGTPAFAATALHALLDAGHEAALVLTRPDRPAGRGLKPAPSAVKQLAQARGLTLAQPASLKDPAAVEALRACGAEVMVVAAYGLILPPAVLILPPRGCLNIHASLLPRWRGAAPIQRALLAGDSHTGITIMQMDAGLDTGAMLLQQEMPIAADDSARSLHDKLAALGGELIVRALRMPAAPGRAQDDMQATYAAKIDKAEARIDWSRAAPLIERQVRAFDPAPGAATLLEGASVKIWQAQAHAGGGAPAAPGTVLAAHGDEIAVACGEGTLRLSVLQKAGGRRMPARDFLAGTALPPGTRFGA